MDSVETRMRAAFELHELTIAMRRQVLAREYPAENRVQVEARLRAWLLHGELPRPPDDSEPPR
ncbi:MAG TPA: hypothetical protein VGV61_14935 [Thermoanaerobaculia bacterium]|jgi:hypothetical protein|nr:hypothetical protein [Thermoanaerobaculia bacterium]